MKAHRWLGLQRADLRWLATLGPVFAGSSAATVMLATLSKALFLASRPVSLLPWVFMGAALVTVASSLLVVAASRRLTLRRRFVLVLAIGSLGLLAMRGAYPAFPGAVGVALLLWCPALGSLVMLHLWTTLTVSLPTRAAKRLVPVLGATATTGAALGGLAIRALTARVAAEDLLVLVVAIFALTGAGLRRVFAEASAAPLAVRSRERHPFREAARDVAAHPMLRELALLVVVLQAGAIVVDYQLSAELQPHFDKQGLAGFLGTFYGLSNAIIVISSLVVTGRLVAGLGIGLALATAALAVGAGSAVYVVAGRASSTSGLWIIAGTAFAERVASYTASRPALQMVYLPLEAARAERVKALIDGAIQRGTTIVVSALLIVSAPTLATQMRLSVPIVGLAAVGLVLGWRLTKHYRRAVFDALARGVFEPVLMPHLKAGVGRATRAAIAEYLDGGTTKETVAALELAREHDLPLEPERLLAFMDHRDDDVAVAAARALASCASPSVAELSDALRPERRGEVLVALLDGLAEQGHAVDGDALRQLCRHPEMAVATAACVLRIRRAGHAASLDAEVRGGDRLPEADRVTGTTRAGDFARELPSLLDHPDRRIRHETVAHMGSLGLAVFVDPLVGCLAHHDLRPVASRALRRLQAHLLPAASTLLGDDALPRSARQALVRILGDVGSESAVHVLVAAVSDPELTSAVLSALWACRQQGRAAIPRAPVAATIAQLFATLESCVAFETRVAGRLTPAHRLLASELGHVVRDSERSLLTALGLLYDQDPMQRVAGNIFSDDKRARSNAIELLEQTVSDAEHGRVVGLLERTRSDERARMSTRGGELAGKPDATLAAGCGPWVARLWSVAERDMPGAQNTESGGDGDVDPLVFRLAAAVEGTRLAGMPVATLAELARFGSIQRLARGRTLFARGGVSSDLWIVLEGTVTLELASATVAVTAGGAVGLAAALDAGPRVGTATAAGPVDALSIPQRVVLELAACDATFAHALVGVLGERLAVVAREDAG